MMSTNNNNNNNNNDASASQLPYSQPPNFTPIELEEIQRLWDVQFRLIPNVYPTSDATAANTNNNQPSLMKKNHNHDGGDQSTMGFISRISTFASAVLTQYQQQQKQQQQPWSNCNPNPFVKPIGQSCLESYCRLFLDNDDADGFNDTTSNSGNDNNNIRLRCGRRIFPIHYGEFMKELNEYEFHEEKPNDTILRDKSFAGFLYFHPKQALPAVNVALAFSILRLWKKQYYSKKHHHNNNGNGNEQIVNSGGTGSIGAAPPPFSKKVLDYVIRYLDTCHIVVRFVHATPHTPMADIKTGLINRFISVKGHVVKAKPKRLRVATSDFQCQKCGAFVTHAFYRGQYSTPTSCSNPTCKGRSFTMKRVSARYINTQELRLQEAQEESTSHAGRTPRQLEVELSNDDDLIDACRPGDIISLACWVDAINSAVAAGRAGKRAQETSTYKLFVHGHSITTLSESVGTAANNKNKSNSQQASQYTQKQLHDITQLCHADHRCFSMTERMSFPFDLLVRSVCPSIIGHHAVKAGILLCLLGGTPPDQQQAGDNKGVTIRSNSHILIVGDPGMGKSQMLNAATQLAARSVYVGGNTSSTTGLTVTLTKEEGGETGIEAGALVMADQGVACIDELDKCKHLDGLLEAMEQQQVSIAKAGVIASLPARCSVIGAANPKHGSYNMSKTVAENLNMARPILSRFDLVFILRDRADKDQDRLVSSNIMNLYRQQQRGGGGGGSLDGKSTVSATNAAATAFPQKSQQYGNNNNKNDENRANSSDPSSLDNRVPLEKRLAWVASFNEPLPANLVRDYIAYAREFCKPQLTVEAAEILREYYMQLRYPTDGRRRQDTVPITTRQLEALIRLSQARAKSCLRRWVLKQDALDVVELLRRSVEQVHTDEFGIIDRTRVGAAGQSNRKMRKAFKQQIHNIIGPGATCDMEDLRRVADQFECPISEFKTMIEELRNDGTLLRKGGGRYEIAS